MADNLKPQSYEQVRQQELTGTGIASWEQTPWPAQKAAQTEQERLSAQRAAKASAANKARQNWKPPVSTSKPNKPLPTKRGK